MMIRFENVMYRYGEDRPAAISDLSLTINPGESVSVMGANGSGKSTFALLVAGLLTPVRGRCDITGEAAVGGVGILFQNPDNQIVAVTVEKEIAFSLENQRVLFEEMEKRITETLERFSISHLRQRMTSELSGGEKQRVALAGVMVSEPLILVLDEPDSFLDQQGKAALRTELLKVRERNPEMIQIHITQYPATAAQYDRLLVFDSGSLVGDASPEQIFTDRSFCEKTALAFSKDHAPVISLPQMSARNMETMNLGINEIQLKQVSFHYHSADNPIVDNLTCSFHAGEIAGIAGCSGSGKSTLGLILCGLLQPSSGQIVFISETGEPVNREDVAGHVAAILQHPERQFFLSSCAEEIAFGPKNFFRPLDSDGVKVLLTMVGLNYCSFADRDPFRLSGGEKRRLAFAAVLSLMPQIVIFDEPTCGLDQEGAGRFVRLVQVMQQQGRGIIIITHDGDILKTLADRIMVLDSEKKIQIVSTSDFYADHQFAATVSPLTWSLD